MSVLNFLGRKVFMGAIVFGVVTAMYYLKSESTMFARYAEFGELAFLTFCGANVLEHFASRKG